MKQSFQEFYEKLHKRRLEMYKELNVEPSDELPWTPKFPPDRRDYGEEDDSYVG